jgi:hypothetical protein
MDRRRRVGQGQMSERCQPVQMPVVYKALDLLVVRTGVPVPVSPRVADGLPRVDLCFLGSNVGYTCSLHQPMPHQMVCG